MALRLRLRDRLGTAGTAAVELALLAPVLATLTTGSWDFGNALLQQERLVSAARAGAQFAVASVANSSNYSGMVQAARNDAADSADLLTINAQKVCTCPSGGTVSCSGTCTGNVSPRVYAQVQVSESYATTVKYPFIGNPIELANTAMLRIN